MMKSRRHYSWALAGCLSACFLITGPSGDVCAQEKRTPLPHPAAKELYQRVLTLPGAELVSSPTEGASGTPLPTFSVFYVYEQSGEWKRVGKDLRRGPEGWVKTSSTQDWSIMLTMQYSPPGQRGRVLFFEKKQDLQDLVTAVDPSSLVRKLEQEADTGAPTTPSLVSIEPSDRQGAQQLKQAYYVVPILKFATENFDSGQKAVLLNVSLVNANREKPKTVTGADVGRMQGAIVFVLDTTISMRPYFERVAQGIKNILSTLMKNGLDQKVAIAVVAYRNNMDQEPQKSGLDYVVKTIQPLDPNASIVDVSNALQGLDEAKVSTHSFSEDAVAGLWTALEKLDWAPFEKLPKLMFFVTDAGAISGKDPKAMYPGIDIVNIYETANRKRINIFPIHIASVEAKHNGNLSQARAQYNSEEYALGRTGDSNNNKYTVVDPATPENFSVAIKGMEEAVTQAFETWSDHKSLDRLAISSTDNKEEAFRKLVINELFNAQQNYIGAVQKTRTSDLFDAWVVDRDLINPARRSLNVSVLLTRDQLSQLSQSANRIYQTAKSQDITANTLFNLLRLLSLGAAHDPARFNTGDNTKLSDMAGLIPDFLKILPYKSFFQGITAQTWSEMSLQAQNERLTELAFKIRAYQEMYSDLDKWQDLGSGDPGQRVMSVPLEYLP